MLNFLILVVPLLLAGAGMVVDSQSTGKYNQATNNTSNNKFKNPFKKLRGIVKAESRLFQVLNHKSLNCQYLKRPERDETSYNNLLKKSYGYEPRPTGLFYIDEKVPAYKNCARDCTLYFAPVTCYYNWTVEHYHVLGPACDRCINGTISDCFSPQCVTADGVERGIMTINRMLPGPQIHVCHHDRIVVDVHNAAGGTGLTIHWHGLKQVNTPWMDGVPMVTQCPIHADDTFRYTFEAAEPGTMFYHAHSGHHKVDGIHGALIVRQSRNIEDNLTMYYEYDNINHTMVLSDWIHERSENLMPGLRYRPDGITVRNFLVNGLGKYYNQTTRLRNNMPYATFYVKSNLKYRFRIINSGSMICPMQVQIENHPMTLLATDGRSIAPETINTLITYSGERFDIAIKPLQGARTYWIRIKGLGQCEVDQIEQWALLVVDLPFTLGIKPTTPEPAYTTLYPQGIQVNHPNITCGLSTQNKCISDLRTWYANPDLLTNTPYARLYIGFGWRIMNVPGFFRTNEFRHFEESVGDVINVGHFNGYSFEFPPSPLLTQNYLAESQGKICRSAGGAYCTNPATCGCTQIITVPLNALIEIVIVDEAESPEIVNHPVHLHGHHVFVTGMGQLPGVNSTAAKAKSSDMSNPFNRVRSNAPQKDTVSVPTNGYVVTRFVADNPGFWLYHCHFEWHMAVGMGFVLQVGSLSQMKTPPASFPTCGNYAPTPTYTW